MVVSDVVTDASNEAGPRAAVKAVESNGPLNASWPEPPGPEIRDTDAAVASTLRGKDPPGEPDAEGKRGFAASIPPFKGQGNGATVSVVQ